MFAFELNDAVVLQQKEVLERLLSTNPKTQKALQKLIRKALMQERASMSQFVAAKLKNGDPRGAARAIRTSVYRKILGGNMNILDGRKAHGTNSYEPPRTLRLGQRGGNRVPRGQRTHEVMHYAGPDRGFILRFVNSGTSERTAGTRNGRLSGKRGSIAPRNFFRAGAEPRLNNAVSMLSGMIDEELEKMLSKKK